MLKSVNLKISEAVRISVQLPMEICVEGKKSIKTLIELKPKKKVQYGKYFTRKRTILTTSSRSWGPGSPFST